MASDLTNGSAPNADIEMKEETLDTSMADLQQDPTDPNPPPQEPSSAAPLPPQTEHLSTLLPAPSTATPPPAAPSTATARPGSIPPNRTNLPELPEKPVAHGGPTRQFLNANLTPHLLEGMKYVAAYEPEKPLMWLSEFLAQRSKEVEG
ncbi:dpy-30 domain-containing protein [Zymoseptoria brevis]|uniref:Dpy-30 domain-containing protein n=1 Tax=Zymoseptoria brevis TaxID=1047168 RepID=A0A0F4G6D7_9PEZI|nr:dpy-30 domain-containing protein [Zymoseptoria brevis]